MNKTSYHAEKKRFASAKMLVHTEKMSFASAKMLFHAEKMSFASAKMLVLAAKMPFAVDNSQENKVSESKKAELYPNFINFVPPCGIASAGDNEEMKLNKFTRQPDNDFARTGTTAVTAILASPSTYGLLSGNATQLNTTMTAFTDALDSLDTIELAYRAAVAAKNDARLVAEQTFTRWLQVSYAAPTVTNEALTGIGLDAKTTGSTPRPLTVPLDLTASPRDTGFVNLKWKRNGNTNSTVFLVEAQIEDGAWDLVYSTNRSTAELSGYEPGVQVSFRVIAQKAGEQSEPSNVFVIYRNGGNVSLELAA